MNVRDTGIYYTKKRIITHLKSNKPIFDKIITDDLALLMYLQEWREYYGEKPLDQERHLDVGKIFKNFSR